MERGLGSPRYSRPGGRRYKLVTSRQFADAPHLDTEIQETTSRSIASSNSSAGLPAGCSADVLVRAGRTSINQLGAPPSARPCFCA